MSHARLSNFAATPGDLRQIVLSYLCDNCYGETAQVFARDTATRELDKDGDTVLTNGEDGVLEAEVVRMVQLRKEIKLRLLAGKIDEAIVMINSHFHAVLGPSGSMLDEPRYNPSHLFLNLKIQNFIEQSRTMPLPWPSDIIPSSNPSTQNSSPIMKYSYLNDDFSLSCESPEEEARKKRLLGLMHELYVLTRALPVPMDRATYLMELSTVGGLLAYPVPEKSREMRKYLDMARREAVADQINKAILYRTNVPLPPVLELSARHTMMLFSTLNDLNQKLPPLEQRPPGADVFLSRSTITHQRDTKDLKAVKEKDSPETVPKFELKTLLGPEST